MTETRETSVEELRRAAHKHTSGIHIHIEPADAPETPCLFCDNEAAAHEAIDALTDRLAAAEQAKIQAVIDNMSMAEDAQAAIALANQLQKKLAAETKEVKSANEGFARLGARLAGAYANLKCEMSKREKAERLSEEKSAIIKAAGHERDELQAHANAADARCRAAEYRAQRIVLDKELAERAEKAERERDENAAEVMRLQGELAEARGEAEAANHSVSMCAEHIEEITTLDGCYVCALDKAECEVERLRAALQDIFEYETLDGKGPVEMARVALRSGDQK
jgi:chromosome segregation ATPase